MKLIFTCIFCAILSFNLGAQVVDTILFENFQVDKFGEWGTVPFGNDETWVTFDEDGLTPYDNDDNHRAWYNSQFFHFGTDSITGETNYCGTSLSYMQGFAPGNRNWLITPPIQVTDANFTLHWKSAPFQLPRYMDGYVVMAAEGSNDIFSDVFTDTLFQAASMETITGTGASINLENFSFTPGYLHADSLRNQDYVVLWNPGDSTLMRGLLEPHSVSLSAYAGKTIYLAFLHNADDDYFLAVDDVLVVRTETSNTEQPLEDFRFVTYPNPVSNFLNVMYRLPQAMQIGFRITNAGGQVVWQQSPEMQLSGEQQSNLNVSRLPAGHYQLTLQAGNTLLSKSFVKQ